MTTGRGRLDIAAARERAAGAGGKRTWRGLDELADTDAFREMLHREFPEQASELEDPLARRRFLQVMGASLALGGLTACAKPLDTIVPYGRQPEQVVPGRPLFFATAFRLEGFATGILVESQTGRPIKVEGNPDHPGSLGAADALALASVLSLYDPDRSQTVLNLGVIRPWADLLGAVRSALEGLRARKGAGLRFLTGTVTSPTLAAQLEEILAELPEARWHQHEPASRDNLREGSKRAFGEIVETSYRFDKADVVVTLDADFMGSGPARLRYTRDAVSRRRVSAPGDTMSRIYAVESTPSITGAKADHRWPARPSEVEGFARALAAALGVDAGGEAAASPVPREAVEAIARDLKAHPGRSLVVAGESQPAFVHALAHAVNQALGNAGSTVVYTDPVEARPMDQAASLRELAEDMAAGRVEMLVMLGVNPAYTAPGELRFAEALPKVGISLHMGLHVDETATLSTWHVGESHDLESWSDARAYDGTVTILQPLIDPLYTTRSAHELLALFSPRPTRSSREIVREHWSRRIPAAELEAAWNRALHDGVMAGTACAPRTPALRADWAGGAAPRPAGTGLEVVFRPDPTVHDGRFANNGWLQELPKPLTRLTWDNAALLAPATAESMGLSNGDVVEIGLGGRTLRAPAWILPGHAAGTVTLHLGYGRTRAGRVGNGAGFDAYAIRPAAAPWIAGGAELRPTGEERPLAVTQEHHSMEGRGLVRSADLHHWEEHPDFAKHFPGEHTPDPGMSMYPPFRDQGYSWGLTFDLNACVGCGACVTACQSENNIPVVGREQVATSREMHWIRVDRYFEGDLDNPATVHQPVPCMHCENAPCEQVCPVAATVHSSEGLNDMVYNRCVGTRYCSNNCPYKVRRFNFLEYSDLKTPSLRLLYNPDVTVRTRGVMEKCTYCVQRINQARNDAERESRDIRDGEIVTACQQACPAQAIVFGNINDPASRVSKAKADPRNYGILESLGTRPRTTYLAALRNPNPEIGKGHA